MRAEPGVQKMQMRGVLTASALVWLERELENRSGYTQSHKNIQVPKTPMEAGP